MIRILLTFLAMAWLTLMVLAPVVIVLVEALSAGVGAWWQAVSDDETRTSVALSLKIAAIVVPCNAVFALPD